MYVQALVSWLRDDLSLMRSAAEVEEFAGSVTSTEGKPRQRAFPVLQTVCCEQPYFRDKDFAGLLAEDSQPAGQSSGFTVAA